MSKSSKQGKEKSYGELLTEVQSKSFAEEIRNDARSFETYLGRSDKARESGADSAIIKQEQLSVDLVKRAMLLIGCGDMQITNSLGEKKAAMDNNLPVSSYLSHGSRVLIEVPAGTDDTLINWLTSGDSEKNGMSKKQTQQQAIAENKIVYNRVAATHDVSIQGMNQKGGLAVRERKGFWIGARDAIGNTLLGIKTKHYGVDLAIGAEFNGKDSRGNVVSKPDGEHGHLYIHYTKPVNGKPGAIMIGIEGASPASSNHSKTGGSSPISPVDGSKLPILEVKQKIAAEAEYQNTILPRKYQGMEIKIDKAKLTEIVEMKAEDYGTNLAYSRPAQNPKDFCQNLSSNKLCKIAELKEAKMPAIIAKPPIWKKLVNNIVKIITCGLIKPYKKELDQYKIQKKNFKIYKKIQDTDKVRLSKEKSFSSGIKQDTLSRDRGKSFSDVELNNRSKIKDRILSI